jgi:hypothetical protein
MRQRAIEGASAAACAAWGVLFLIVAGIVVLGGDRTVTHHYWGAGANWLAARPLYDGGVVAFIYLPHAAVLFTPFALMPFQVAEVSWRFLTIGAYAYGVWRLACLSDRERASDLFPMMTLVCLPVAFDSARNGQATLLVTALMIAAVEDLARQRWTRAAVWLYLSVCIKPLGVFLLVLTALLYRPMRVRLLAGLAIVAPLPFLAQRPDYVVSQYQAGAHMAVAIASVAPPEYSHVFSLMTVAGIRPSATLQAVIRILAAVATVAACLFAVRRHTPAQTAVWLFVFHACAITLFSPRTELTTYAALAPAIAVLCARAWRIERRHLAGAALMSLAVVTALSYELGRLLLPGHPPTWPAPLMAVCFTIYALRRARIPSPLNVPVSQ